MTLLFRYWRVGAPWGGASLGMVKPGSGCCEADLEPESPLVLRIGVPVRAGIGDAAVAGVEATLAGAGD